MPASPLSHLLQQNRTWSESMRSEDEEFCSRLVNQQNPEYLWIGCADSRVPANEIVGMLPGELFVHRNVANIVVHTDLNCLSVLQYAVVQKYDAHLASIVAEEMRGDRLCELNVIEQVVNVCQTTIVESAWEKGQELSVHGWIYRLSDGLIRDLQVSISSTEDIATCREKAANRLIHRLA